MLPNRIIGTPPSGRACRDPRRNGGDVAGISGNVKTRARLAGGALALAIGAFAPSSSADADLTIDPSAWQLVKRESGPVNYYSVGNEGGTSFVRSKYAPPMKTALLGWQAADGDRKRIRKVRWTWRAQTLPNGGDECVSGKGDSAAVVYLTWKRGLKYYTLKYVWSAVGTKGAVCDQKRNPFVAQNTIILESGGPLNTWRTEEIDLASEFRRHFEGGDPNASVPDFVGMGIMSDGDQTKSESSADYGTFVVVR